MCEAAHNPIHRFSLLELDNVIGVKSLFLLYFYVSLNSNRTSGLLEVSAAGGETEATRATALAIVILAANRSSIQPKIVTTQLRNPGKVENYWLTLKLLGSSHS